MDSGKPEPFHGGMHGYIFDLQGKFLSQKLVYY